VKPPPMLPGALVTSLLFALGAWGCVDLAPVDFQAPEGGAIAEAGADAPGDGAARGALAAACAACLSTGPCASSFMACQANTACARFIECATPTLCWAANVTDFSALPPCLIQCSAVAGITSQNDPASILLTPIFACAQDPAQCGAACSGGADR
jgi:hypothetical protein